MIKRAKLHNKDIHFEIIESGKLPFPNHSFDAVLIFAVLFILTISY
ncbi:MULTISPECIES: class I SAM-dependent methyltransferase [Bacillus]|nr:class I SAM-dependent methyltransferase [Bacillus rhizoplanae]